MNDVLSDDAASIGKAGAGAVRRRHVIYLCGYDPRGAQGYFDLFRRTCDRSQRLWPVAVKWQPGEADTEDFAHWRLDMSGADWHTTTHYDFQRLERFIRADMAGSTARQLPRALSWFIDDVASGALFRIFRASWRFGAHLLCFQLLLLAWVAVAAAAAVIAGLLIDRYLGWPPWAAIVSSLAVLLLVVVALRPLADKWRLIQISNSWTNHRRFGCDRPTWLDAAIEVGAQRVVAVARANEADEVVVVGHSSGCVVASAIVARAFELDPALGGSGPRLVLLTLGSVMPAVALHPAARRMRHIVGQLVAAPGLVWVDCQSRKDVMCFANFDPVEGIGVDAGTRPNHPLPWRISFRDVIAVEKYNRFRWNHFRVHYQYIMGGDQRGPYDYALLIGGPAAIAQWPKQARDLTSAFGNGAFAKDLRNCAAATS